MKKLGAITIGQSPRVDMVPEMKKYLGDVEVLEMGALDGISRAEIEAMTPREGDYVLVSKLNDGSSVKFGKSHIIPLLQNCISTLEEKGVDLILFLCTGVFVDPFESTVPIVYPDKILAGVIPTVTDKQVLGVMTPDEKQVAQAEAKWGKLVDRLEVRHGSPYKETEDIIRAARELKEAGADVILLDCMGFDEEMKRVVMDESGKLVILSKTLVARVMGEMLNY